MPNSVPTLAVFRNRTFRMLWIATLASNFGGLVQSVGAAWMMTSLTASHSMVALVQSSVTLPIMIFSLAAGVFADNFDRRKIMLWAQGFMCVVSVVLAFLAFENLLTPWLLLTFTFLIGCGTAMHIPSWQASVGDIVTREELSAAVSVNSMGFNMMRSVGPAAGGAIVALAGAAAAFAVNALSYVAIIAALLGWRPALAPRRLPREPFGSAFAAGLRYVALSPNLVRTIARGFVFGLSAVVILALLPLVVRDHLAGDALVYGALLGCFGFGAVFGALANGWLRDRYRNETIVRLGFSGFAVTCVVLALSDIAMFNALALLLAGFCWVISMSLFNVTMQLSTPRWVVGRVLALYQTGVFGGMAGGSWLWGAIAESAGLGSALLIAGALLLCGALVGLIAPLPDSSDLNLDPLNRFSEPPLQLDITPRSGPIMIMIDYRIDQGDVPRFLDLMNQHRRVRIRDGAQQWALLRDLEDPDLWTESYHVPTWVEYIRHHERRTQADFGVFEEISKLHKGTRPLRVHRLIERQTVSPRDNIPRRPGRAAEPPVENPDETGR
ncbi:MFS transporter [Pukyongiella litopenaei]|uniref:MFS transporter n=1 Tax=Pukyongiella litopenaei TaxID=2605946 RepID=A0A2S0MN80_9RHOB|nr:MFS transporter [Pukyongiella litopenaei]AVO37287.1 MFS transporter [Pukyongiella litopenaei]